MVTQIDAIYQNGVFKPLQDVSLAENQRVRLSVDALDVANVRAWLSEVHELQERIVARRGYFPDSAIEIAEDRRR